jgi:hypothetical protein
MKKVTLAAFTAFLLITSITQAEWQCGLGTGIGISSYDGDLAIDGVGKLDVEFDQDDFERGFGAAGFATDGTWILNLNGSMVEYESNGIISGNPQSTNTFERTFAEFTAGYVAYREDAITLIPYIGINYTNHDWEFSNQQDLEDSWIDGILGIQFNYKVNHEWTWNNSAEYATGDSEGCFEIKTGT